MKKIILLTLATIFAWTGIAMADACVIIRRAPHWMDAWNQGTVNKLSDEERAEYDARIQPYDIITVYEAYRCPPPPVQDPTARNVAVVIYGLDFAEAKLYAEAYFDFTGEVEPETGIPYSYVKKNRKFGLNNGNLPGPVRTLFEENSHLEFQWSDICGFVLNKLTDLTGAMCP